MAHSPSRRHLEPPSSKYCSDEFFTDYYQHRLHPHRAIGRTTPIQAFNAPAQGHPDRLRDTAHCRVRADTIDAAGVITIRYNSRLHHIRPREKRRTGTKVTVLIDDRDIRILDRDTGQLIRKLVLDPTPRLPTTRHHMRKLTRKQAEGVNHVPGHLSTSYQT